MVVVLVGTCLLDRSGGRRMLTVPRYSRSSLRGTSADQKEQDAYLDSIGVDAALRQRCVAALTVST